jgi:hypothetical protein
MLMRPQRRVALALTIAAVIAMATACDDDGAQPDDPSPSPTQTVAPAPTRAAYMPDPPASDEPATIGACPVDDPALCDFAVELQSALNAGDVGFIVDRLAPRERPCRDVIYASDDDVGCTTSEGTSEPVVFWLVTQGDCCSTGPARFRQSLEEFLVDASVEDGRWRVYGVMSEHPGSFRGDSTILLMKGTGENAALLNFGTVREGDRPLIRGAIHGTRASFFVFPGSELARWP